MAFDPSTATPAPPDAAPPSGFDPTTAKPAPVDASIPQPGQKPVPLPTGPSTMQRAINALSESFAGPYGPSEATMKPFVGNDDTLLSAINRTVVGGGLTALDIAGRPFSAAVKVPAAIAGGVEQAITGNRTVGDKLQRDLTQMGDLALMEAGRQPVFPKPALETNIGGKIAETAKAAGPKALRWAWDVDKTSPEKLAAVREIAEEGGRVPIQQWAIVPFFGRLTEIAKGWGYDPVKEAATTFYEKNARKVLENLGVDIGKEAELTDATSAVSMKEAGAASVERANKIIQEATDQLDRKVQSYVASRVAPVKDVARERARDISLEQQSLVAAAEESRAAATKAIDEGFTEINRTMDAALSGDVAQSGNLMASAADKFKELRGQVGRYFNKKYDAADQAAEGHHPDVSALAPWAESMLEGLLPPVRAQYPREIELLTRLAAKEEEEAPKPTGLLDQFGAPIVKEVTPPAAPEVTFGQLHQLRSWVRHSIDWEDLAAGPKQGVQKLLEKEINGILHDQEASPELRAAATILDETDKEYGSVIPRFKDTVLRQIMKSGTAAAPENASKLASMIITEHNTDRIGMFKEMLGPDIWRRVQAADLRSIVSHSLDNTGQFDPAAFARKIMERSNLGMLEPTFGKAESAKLVEQAKRVQQMYGKFDVNVLPGDTVTTLLQRATEAMDRAENLAELDPLGELKRQTAAVEARAKSMRAAGMADIEKNPLHNIISMEGEAAAKKILSSRDLLESAAAQFGETSPEFTALRQSWARQFLQRDINAVKDFPKELSQFPEEVQRLLFPGVTLDQMLKLSKQMRLMFPREADATAVGMSGMSMVFHPEHAAFLPKWVQNLISATGPLHGMVGRFTVGTGLNLIARLSTSPALVRFVTKGMDGTEAQQAAAQVALLSIATGKTPAVAMAAGAEVLREQLAAEPEPEPAPSPPSKRRNWREMLGSSQSQSRWAQKLREATQ